MIKKYILNNDHECLQRIRCRGRSYDTICLQRQERTYSQGQHAQYPNQHIDIEIPHGSRDYVIVLDTVKITFNLGIESIDKALSVVNNVGRALVKEKVLMIGSKDMDTINNLNVYDTYNDLYLDETEREEKLLQGIQLANGLKVWMGAKKADGTTLTETTQENAIRKTFDKRFAIPLNFDRLSDISLEFNEDLCHKHRPDVYWNNVNPIHQGKIDLLPDTV